MNKKCDFNYDNYYTTKEVAGIFKENGISTDCKCKGFLLALKKYDVDLHEKVIKNTSSRNYFDKEFIDGLDFNYLREAEGHKKFSELFKYQFGDNLKINSPYYTLKEVTDIFAKNGLEVDCPGLFRALRHFDECLYEKVLIKPKGVKLVKKEFIDEFDFDYFRLLKQQNTSKIFLAFLEHQVYGLSTIFMASKILDCNFGSLKRLIHEDNNIFDLITKGETEFVETKRVLEWAEFKDSAIAIHDIGAKVTENIDEKVRGRRLYYSRKIIEMYENGIFDRFEPVPENLTPFRTKTKNQLYVNKEYEDEIYQILENELVGKTVKSFGSQVDKFNYELGLIDKKHTKRTFEYFSEFAISRMTNIAHSNAITYIDIAHSIKNLNKEITQCTTKEVQAMGNNLSTKTAKREFTYFLKLLKQKKNTKYSDIDYDRDNNRKEKKSHLPYSEEQYLRFGFLVWSDSHIWYDSYMEKALEKREYACVWLYAALHYTCAWRAGDLIEQFPRPNLNMDPKVFLEKVKNKELEDKYALDIIEQVNMKIELEEPKPNKTKAHNPPSLVLEIPESVYVFLGTLIGIVEAHYQLSTDPRKKGLISHQCKTRESQVEFFGKEFVEIFGDDRFTNLKAVKNYEIIMSKKGDDKKVGTGYVLASIARSHKQIFDKKAETTQVYVKYYKDMEDAEVIVRELFERGVCSFAPYLLTKIVVGEENMKKLTQEEKTKKLKETAPLDAYESEMFIQEYNDALANAKRVVKELVDHAVEEGVEPKTLAKNALVNLIYDKAPAKQEKFYCMRIAQGKDCIYKKRKDCIGCGYEVYVKSCLSELGNRIRKAQQEALSSKTQNSKNKNMLLLQNVLLPITKEILITLRDEHKVENLEEYKQLIK